MGHPSSYRRKEEERRRRFLSDGGGGSHRAGAQSISARESPRDWVAPGQLTGGRPRIVGFHCDDLRHHTGRRGRFRQRQPGDAFPHSVDGSSVFGGCCSSTVSWESSTAAYEDFAHGNGGAPALRRPSSPRSTFPIRLSRLPPSLAASSGPALFSGTRI